MNTSTYSEVSSTPEGVKEGDDDLKSQDNQNITDKDIEDMLLKVKEVQHGFLGDCGVFYKVALGDRYVCFDTQQNEVNNCVRNIWYPTRHVHICCPGPGVCMDSMKIIQIDFGPVL